MRKNKTGYSAAAFVAVFAFAGRALSVGKSSAIDGIIAAAIALFIIPTAAVTANSFFKNKPVGVLSAVFSAAVIAVSGYIAAATAREFTSFASEVMLLRISPLLIGGIFLALCAFLASQGERSVRKFALISFVITAAVVILLFALSARSFDTWGKEPLLSGAPTVKGVLREFGEIFAPAVLAVIYLSMEGKEGGLRAHKAILSVAAASVLLFVCRLNVRLLFSESFALSREYPYSEAVSTVTAGKLFARMEGWAYLMYYASSASRLTICLSLICRMLPSAWRKGKLGKFLPYLAAAAVAVCLI